MLFHQEGYVNMEKIKLGKKFCLQCDSENVQAVAGGIGGSWVCKDCGYVGMLPEKPHEDDDEENPLLKEDLEEIKESLKKSEGKNK